MAELKCTRSRFIWLAGIGVVSLGGYAVCQRPRISLIRQKIKEIKNMKKVWLIAYASRCGSTAEVAQAIAAGVKAKGYEVELLPAAEVVDIRPYAGVILGSAVRFGNWLPEMNRLVMSQQAVLQSKPCALFSCHILNLGDDKKARQSRAKYTRPIHSCLQPVAEVFFAGNGDTARLALGEKVLARLTGAPRDERRDWVKIRAWADLLAGQMMASQQSGGIKAEAMETAR